MSTRQLYYRITRGIRVTARPRYLPDQSDVDEPRYVFAYRIRIENVGGSAVQLLRRHWYIHDPVAGDSEVEGEGVVGEQPMLGPGDVHEYQSFCVLRAPQGQMNGTYLFVRADGGTFEAEIPRFELRAFDA